MKSPLTPRDMLDRGVRQLRRLLSFWRRALIVFGVTALVLGPISVTRPRSYKSETVILYQDTIRSIDLTGNSREGLPDGARRLGARLREVLMSRASLEPIVVDLHLYRRAVEQHGLVDAVDEMRKHITFRAREGDTFEIAFEGRSPDEVQEVTQRLAYSIVKDAADRREEHARTLKEFVDAESERNKTELRVKEGALASFLVARPEFKRRAGLDAHAPLVTRTESLTIAALQDRAARIEKQIAAAPSARPATAGATKKPEPLPDSPELIAARRDLADKLSKYTNRHPDVLAARARLRAAEAAQAKQAVEQAQAAAGAAMNDEPLPSPDGRADALGDKEALRRELTILQLQIAARRTAAAAGTGTGTGGGADAGAVAPAASLVAPSPGETSGSVALEVEFSRLQREVNDARERQRQLDETQFRASINASSVMDDRNIQVSVLDPAYRPAHAISRPRSTLLGGALLLCLVLALVTAGLSAWLDDRVLDRADLEHLDVVPLLAVIPRATLVAPLRSSEHG